MSIAGFELPFPVILLGTVLGLTYGVLAVGLVLVYRTNKIINFAHGEIGAFGASLFLLLSLRAHIPYYIGFVLAMIAAAAIGAGSEVLVVRRLRKAPKIMSIIATLGLGQFLVLFSLAINNQAGAGNLYPEPSWLPTFPVGALQVTQAYFGMLVFTPLLVAGLALFLRYSRIGTAIRGASANAEVARLSGIPASRMSSLAWAIAGGVSAFTAILFAPTTGFVGGAFGPGLLLRALVAGVIARMSNLPVALAAGVGVGIVEQLLLWNNPRGGLVEAVLFVIILVALLFQRKIGAREEDKGSWAAVQPIKPLPEALRALPSVRRLPYVVAGGVFLALALLPIVMSNSNSITLVGLFAFAIVGLSVGIVTGLGGQLSLGQFAIAGIGATISWYVSSRSGNFILSFAYAALGGAAVSLLIGIPALRIRGLLLAVTTLGFALVTQSWLLQQPWTLGEGVDPGRPIVWGIPLDTGKTYYFFALFVLACTVWLARNIWRSGVGRQLVAIRDNEDNARAFTVPATAVKLRGFVLAGVFAGIGGAVYGHALSRISISSFPANTSVVVAAIAVIGGIGLMSGPLLGAALILGVPAFLPLDSAGLAATALGQLLLILYFPAGLAQFVGPLRDRIVDRLARRAGVDAAAVRAEAESPLGTETERTSSLEVATRAAREEAHAIAAGAVLLEATDLRKRFGGVVAVDGVSLRVRAGQTVGMIGPNGAGKTTTFELLGGFTKPDTGTVVFGGQDVSNMGPEARARLGMIRSFQGAPLFGTMTVLEVVTLALEKELPTRVTTSLLGYEPRERLKEARARELVNLMGLDRYRNKVIGELSTGTRRITEIACLIALQPRMLLLDEPASGVAQREIEAMTGLLAEIKRHLQTTFLVIEHDIPMIMAISDRILAMDTGRIIAAGQPQAVRNDPLVIEAYLGGSLAAIERSGVRTAEPAEAGIVPAPALVRP